MAITLRGTKGSALSHTELDNNFREFFYSASVDGSSVLFHKYYAISESIEFPVDPPSGLDGYIQLKVGNAPSGAQATTTGSDHFVFDYDNKIFTVTGSTNMLGDVNINGTLTAEQFVTTITSSSVVYQSGSTQFGDTSDDTHTFIGTIQHTGGYQQTGNSSITGKLTVSNGITGSTDFNTLVNKPRLVSSSIQIGSEISGSSTLLSQSISTNLTNLSSSVASELDVRLLSASAVSNTITFTKGDASTFSVTIDTGSFTLTPTGSLITTASAVGSTLTFTKGDSSTFDVNIITGSSVEVVLDSSPQLGANLDLNTNNISGSGSIDIVGNVSASNAHFDGTVTATGDITAFYSSDERLKDNVTTIGSAIDKINQIGGYEFDWNSNSEHSGHDVGVIAQEIEKVLPEVVTTRDNGYKAVRYEKIVALLIQAVKEQQLQIDELKSKL